MIWLMTFWRGVALRLLLERFQMGQQFLVDEANMHQGAAVLESVRMGPPGAAQSRQR